MHSLLQSVLWMNKTPAAGLHQKRGKYFLIFHGAVNFSQKFSILQSPAENALENTAPWSILEGMFF